MFEFVEGDAFEELESLPPESAHCAVVDYPWNFDIRNGSGRFEFRARAEDTRENIREDDDHMYRMEEDDRVPELLNLLTDVLVDGAWIMFFADDRFQDPVRRAMKDNEELIFRRNWAWSPNQFGMGYYGRITHYPIPVATKGETERYVRDRGTLYKVDGGRNTEYATGKPMSLYRDLLREPVLRKDETLLEPFCGSAPGAYVARERDLGYWGCDIDPESFEDREKDVERTNLLDL